MGLAARERFWRSLAATGDPAATASPQRIPLATGRRDFIKLMGASLALAGTSGCSRPPPERIVPYRDGPSQQTYGKPVYYASALGHDGYGLGVLVETNMGRPTKIEGNPLHPASGGATDVFRQAAVLELWDPDRSRTVRHGRTIATWDDFLAALRSWLRAVAARRGAGLHLLTGTVASPWAYAEIASLLDRLPDARWHQWQPVNRDHAIAGGVLAYGQPLEALHRFDRARCVVALDGDFLDDHPAFVRYALDFAATRRAPASTAARSRLYALECTPTLTGAAADHRWPLRASEIPSAAQALAAALGIGDPPAQRGVLRSDWIDAAAADLRRHAGASIVVAGARQPPALHALVHAMNEKLGNVGSTVSLIPSAAARPIDHASSLRQLVDAMRAGEVAILVMTGVNPAYTTSGDLGFVDALSKVGFKVHHGLYRDETAACCDWHVPATHALESWGDLASFDGTVSLQQPCIAPLYGGKSLRELLAPLAGGDAMSPRDALRAYWRGRHGTDFEAYFAAALRNGFVEGSAPAAKRPQLRAAAARQSPGDPEPPGDDIELVLAADTRVGDGSYANNAWLQELPKPLSLLTWDNAALMSPALAARLGVENDDVVDLRVGDRRVAAPAWIMPGMPDRSVTLALGYGRSAAGEVGNGRGANAYALRTAAAPSLLRGLAISRTGRRHALASVQTHHSMEGRDIVRSYSVAEADACTQAACGGHRDARSQYASPPTGPQAWAMSVDLSACIGCGACTIACQAENNIPVVGPDEVRNGREMHWIRVDRYYEGSPDDPRSFFQPVPCMQCEHAPCEVVCPVEASVHDAQGINVQVYNRCVGTRFCSNNCPYKVRRFNFLAYSRDVPGLDAQRNPEVTVRMRGVLEKCNYCLQRITTAKIAADRDGRRLRDGDVVTACQAVCPARAIVFGDLADPESEVARRKRSPLDYALLGELNTRPRTTYLARILNPSADLRA